MTALLDTLVPLPVGHATMLVPGHDGDHLFTVYREGRWYEQDLLDAIRELQHGGVFVDVGAGYGNHTVFFAVECAADQVIAVEPYPGNFAILEANVRHNDLGDVVTAHNALIHPSWQSATLNPPAGVELPETWWWSRQPVLTEHGGTECFTLDEILAGTNVALVKIDIEEMGAAALRSGAAMLARCKPLVAIEAEPSEQDEVAAVLEPLGYRCLGCYCATPTFLWQAA